MTRPTPLQFIHGLHHGEIPATARARTRDHLLDLIGVAAAGSALRSGAIMRDFAHAQMHGPLPMLFDGRGANAPGTALAAGMTIDALDGHDGFNPSKGHIGCPLFSAMLPVAIQQRISGRAFLEALTMGYEFGARAAMAQHGTVADYHTSGSWGAVTGAAACARLLSLDGERTRHALGIAEYHGPRSQMMRCIDTPTMLKDGSSWGAMAGVSAALLAQAGFTGAPAITVEQAPEYWADLGQRWYVLEQYHKPYPVCRWAQAPIAAILALRKAHGLTGADVASIAITTFHAAVRLATSEPQTTDEAQYSTSFPCAVALVHGTVGPAEIADNALQDPEVLRLSRATTMIEDDRANALFPGRRLAWVSLTLNDGTILHSDWAEPRWDHTAPATSQELRDKFHAYAAPVLGQSRAAAIEAAVANLDQTPLAALTDLLIQPINRATTPGNSA